jgi:crotonobetainyl-CoA:carnitine CoA-transferase CaiB-like acyl-CoA transferase
MSNVLPLQGITVVELGHSVAAPYTGLIFAELGADVIKIEKPGGGDDARGWGPPFAEGAGTMFNALNRHKKSVTIDLKSPDGVAQVRKLTDKADIFVQNLRPGQAEDYGIGPAHLQATNPRLIYASVTAYGDEGPLADRPGYDPLMQAFGGIMSVTGEQGRPSVRVGTSIVDMATGMWVVVGALAALNTRAQTGKGSVIGTSLYETALGWMAYHAPSYAVSKELPKKHGSGIFTVAPYQAFNATDGEIIVAAGNDNLFRKFCGVIGRPAWPEDPRFKTNRDRVTNRVVLCSDIEKIIGAQSTTYWMEKLEAAGVPCAPVQTMDRVMTHPQTLALDILRQGGEGATYFGLPLRIDGARPGRNDPTPQLGADNALLKK